MNKKNVAENRTLLNYFGKKERLNLKEGETNASK